MQRRTRIRRVDVKVLATKHDRMGIVRSQAIGDIVIAGYTTDLTVSARMLIRHLPLLRLAL